MSSESSPFRRAWLATEQWLKRTPDRALDQAYDAVLKIKAIEDEHFAGQTLTAGTYSRSGQDFFESDVNQYLRIARVRMAEFKTSRRFLTLSDRRALGFGRFGSDPNSPSLDQILNQLDGADRTDSETLLLIEKLRFVDSVLERYRNPESTMGRSTSLVPLETTSPGISPGMVQAASQSFTAAPRSAAQPRPKNSSTQQPRVLPRSLLGTVDRIRENLDPHAEENVVDRFRSSKAQTTMALRFFLILLLVPLLIQQTSKTFVVGPLVDRVYRGPELTVSFLNAEFEEEALGELTHYRELLELKSLVGVEPKLSAEDVEDKLKEKAIEIAGEFQNKGADALKNVFADLIAMVTFAIVLLNSRVQLAALKAFIDEIVYGLSDSAKAFILILLTDVFVGFHSPHGWEVLLEGVSRHLGIAANHDFIFLFIATFPVILDTVFKYWIFRYLNRISPSAVATYKNMNE
jgi:CemA family